MRRGRGKNPFFVRIFTKIFIHLICKAIGLLFKESVALFFFIDFSISQSPLIPYLCPQNQHQMNIVITGASQGIGYATVKKLSHDSSHRIVAIARNGEKLALLRQECLAENPESQIFPVAFDLSSPGYSFNLLPAVLKAFNTVDVLINNAGLLVKKEFLHLTDEDFDRAFDVNVKAVFKLTRSLLGYFSNPAHIVNISSMGGVQGSSKFPVLRCTALPKEPLP